MDLIFEVTDKSGRQIQLSNDRWKHINQEHPEVVPHLEDIKDALINPLKVVQYEYDESIHYYYKYFKQKHPQYLLVIIKYLNGKGFIITAYFVRNIK